MSGSFKRALGAWLQSASGIAVVARAPITQGQHPAYPFATVAELAGDTEPLGCGPKDYVTRNSETGWVEKSGRHFVTTEDYRFQVFAADTTSKSGQQTIDDAMTALEEAAMALRAQRTPKTLTDAGVTPSESFVVEVLTVGNRRNQEAVASALPVLYSGTATVHVVRYRQAERAVDGVIQNIDVHEDEGE